MSVASFEVGRNSLLDALFNLATDFDGFSYYLVALIHVSPLSVRFPFAVRRHTQQRMGSRLASIPIGECVDRSHRYHSKRSQYRRRLRSTS